ncbi:MAG: hypothetical protein WBR29_03185 [Gammaproteobacteria bacterium]
MNIRTGAALLVSVVAAAMCFYLPFVPQTVLSIGTRPLDSQHYTITMSAYGPSLPSGLQDGDVIDTAQMDLKSRLGITTYAIPPMGTRITLAIDKQGHEAHVPVDFVSMPVTTLNMIDIVLGIALIWLVAALGILILWRGRRLAAAGVGIWCLGKLCWEIPISLPLPLPEAGWVGIIGMTLFSAGTLIGMYLVAEDLAWEQTSNRIRLRIRTGFLLLVITYLSLFVSNELAFHLGGSWLLDPARLNVGTLTQLLAFAIPVGMLALRYPHVLAMERARIRWILVSVLGIVAAYLVNSTLDGTLLNDVQSDIFYSIFNAAAFIGFTYAVLRHRLVAVNVVLNRALVYGLATTMVVAVFGLLESFIEHEASGERASTLVALTVPLVLGITLNRIHKRIDHWVEYLFFRRQFRAEAALSQFAKECGYITSSHVLLDRALGAILKNTGAPAAAIYEFDGNGYRRLREKGQCSFPEHVSVDDPACVRLRANVTETTLDDLESAFGAEGVIFPVALRGLLIGALVCAPRPGELYTPKERTLVLQLAHEVGASLHAMYVNKAQSFLTEVANGMLPSSMKTRQAAQQLLQLRAAE